MRAAIHPVLSVRTGHQWYGIDVEHVIEVLHFVALDELPGAPPGVLGLITVRDTVMPVIDLRIHFGLSEAPLRLNTPIVAVHTPTGAMGLVVDEADTVEEVSVEQMSAYDSSESPYVTAVVRVSKRLLLLLDTSRFRRETRVDLAPVDAG